MPRPTVFTPELGALVCEKLAECGSLRRVCLDPAMPLERTVRRWYTENETFASEYARSKEAGIDGLVEEALDITDEVPPTNQHGGVDTGHVAWAKNRREYRQWLAERMAPKKYGNKTGVDLTSSDGSMATGDATQRAARAATLLKLAQARKVITEIDINDLV